MSNSTLVASDTNFVSACDAEVKTAKFAIFADFANCCLQKAAANSSYDCITKFCIHPSGINAGHESLGGNPKALVCYVGSASQYWDSALGVFDAMVEYTYGKKPS